jgi:hypothetical protein
VVDAFHRSNAQRRFEALVFVTTRLDRNDNRDCERSFTSPLEGEVDPRPPKRVSAKAAVDREGGLLGFAFDSNASINLPLTPLPDPPPQGGRGKNLAQSGENFVAGFVTN